MILMVNALKSLYQERSRTSTRFRYFLILMDISTLIFLVLSNFFYSSPIIKIFEIIFGLYILSDFIARFATSNSKVGFLFKPYSLIDLIVIISFLLPILLIHHFGFLRVFSIIRLLRSYQVLSRLRKDFNFFRRYEDIIISAINLLMFIFIMTELVYQTQVQINPNINNFVDALYFTITTLTTTGFGDITLKDHTGRILSILMMIFGVSLFLRLIQTIFRPNKVRFICKACGLYLHDRDAVHCKHCGKILKIPDEGVY